MKEIKELSVFLKGFVIFLNFYFENKVKNVEKGKLLCSTHHDWLHSLLVNEKYDLMMIFFY